MECIEDHVFFFANTLLLFSHFVMFKIKNNINNVNIIMTNEFKTLKKYLVLNRIKSKHFFFF